jgi:mono/diheme cytochrome c family protein
MSETTERVFSSLSGLEGGSDRTGNGRAERTPAADPRVWAFAMCLVALLLAFGANWVVPNCARAEEDEVQKARVEAGRVWYEKYCVPCHGAGGAPGKAVYRANKQPVDLRSYVQRHGGAFPAADWIAAVYSPNPAGTHSKVWENLKRAQGAGQHPEFGARGVVAVIADYIISVQTK